MDAATGRGDRADGRRSGASTQRQPAGADAMTADRADDRELAAGLRRTLHDIGVGHALPNRARIGDLCDTLLAALYPGIFLSPDQDCPDALRADADIENLRARHLAALRQGLSQAIALALMVDGGKAGPPADAALIAHALVADDLRAVAELIASDVEAAFGNDPAATSREVIVASYPCIEALAVQRFAHRLYRRGVPLVPRMMTETAHSRTGIDIHPGAAIGASFFIDHGTGVVIGETAVIGAHCVLYHGVTLGAFNPLVRDEHGDLQRGAANKRHPTLEDHVTVYPGATILGGDTVIGEHCVIGGNVWLTHSVEAHSVVTITDPELNIRQRRRSGDARPAR